MAHGSKSGKNPTRFIFKRAKPQPKKIVKLISKLKVKPYGF